MSNILNKTIDIIRVVLIVVEGTGWGHPKVSLQQFRNGRPNTRWIRLYGANCWKIEDVGYSHAASDLSDDARVATIYAYLLLSSSFRVLLLASNLEIDHHAELFNDNL